MFFLGRLGQNHFKNYLGLTQIESHAMQNLKKKHGMEAQQC